MSESGITYDDSNSDNIEPLHAPEDETEQGIRISEERWSKEQFTVSYEETQNKAVDKQVLDTGQLVLVREQKDVTRQPYRVERTEHKNRIEIILTSCEDNDQIEFVSQSPYGYKWKAKQNGETKLGHELSVIPVSDQFLVDELNAEEEYVSQAI